MNAQNAFPFWIILVFYIVSEYGFAIRARLLRRGHPKKQNRDRLSFYIVTLGIDFFVFLAFICSFQRLGVLPRWMGYAGDALILAGMVIRFGAIIQLGRFFSHAVSVVSNQELIHTGFYRRIRNPSYTGGWMIAAGIGLGLRTWWGALLAAAGTLLIYAYRIHIEEKVMIQHFGDRYIQYIKSTKKMFPWIW